MSGQRVMLWIVALVAIIAAVGYRVSVFREPAPPPASKILFVTGGSGPYWQSTVAGAKAAARDLDVELKVEMPAEDENLEQQTAILSDLDADLDGIALSPLDAGGQTQLINSLVKKMRVVTFDSDAEKSDRHSHIGTSNFSAGRACAVGERGAAGGRKGGRAAGEPDEGESHRPQRRISGTHRSIGRRCRETRRRAAIHDRRLFRGRRQ